MISLNRSEDVGKPMHRKSSPLLPIRRLYLRAACRLRERLAARRHAKERMLFVIDATALGMPQPVSAVTFRELSPEEAQVHATSVGLPPASGDGLETGCVVGTLEGQQVYHAWYIRADAARMHGLPVDWRPAGRVLFLHDGFTELPFRGRGIHSAATKWLLWREQGTSTTHVVCLVYANNPAAQRAVRKAGFRCIARVH